MKHTIVIGSGIAGLIAALELSRTHHVTLVTKATLADGNTRFAQGGIAAAMFADDSVEEHIADTLRAGAGLCDSAAVTVLCSEGPERVRDLIELGVHFDMRDGELARGLEAAHTRPRVLHAGGDATGLTIETALVKAVRAAGIRVLEHTFALDLALEDRCVAGLDILHQSGRFERLDAEAVVLASGGAGQLFLHTTNPAVATGDGVAMALHAGAQVSDLEFYQFHPTALAVPETFLVSEAVRGDGAVLRDAQGRRFMLDVHSDAELAPRDVVARGIADAMARQDGKPVLLDATALGAAFLRERFPTIDAACRSRGLDWSSTPIPVTPAAHYWMGGVRTDLWGRTSLPGLFAVGEVACTGVHGANRLASNSLLESLVFAWRAAEFLGRNTGALSAADLQNSNGCDFLAAEREASSGATPIARRDLQEIMWDAVGITRDRDGMERAARLVASSASPGSGIEERETANLLAIARPMIAAALAREESRGAHFRRDFPAPSSRFQHSLVFAEVPVPC